MSNFCNRNNLEYRLVQNAPDYVGLAEWFVVDPGSPSETELNTQPRKYLFVPEGTDTVVEKSQDGKDQADELEQALITANARDEAEQDVDSTLQPAAMATRAWQEVTTDDLNAQIANLTKTLTTASQVNGFSAFQDAINEGLGAQDPITDADRETRTKAKIAAGEADGPAAGDVVVTTAPGPSTTPKKPKRRR